MPESARVECGNVDAGNCGDRHPVHHEIRSDLRDSHHLYQRLDGSAATDGLIE